MGLLDGEFADGDTVEETATPEGIVFHRAAAAADAAPTE